VSQSAKSVQLLSAKRKRAIAISLILAGILYLGAVEYLGHAETVAAIAQLGWRGWIFILACSLANYSLRFLRWQYYIRQSGTVLPTARHFIYYLAGFALTTTPGKAGETIRSVFLRPYGITYPTSLACFFVERFLDVLVVACLSMLMILAVDQHTSLVLIYTAVIVALLPIIRSTYVTRTLSWLRDRFAPETRLRWLLQHALYLLEHARHLLGWRPLYAGFAVGALAWTIQGIAFYSIAAAMGFAPGLTVVIGIYAISLLAGAASFIPGGLGSTEAAMAGLLILVGAEAHTAWAVAITSRVATLWFAVMLGLIANGLISAGWLPGPEQGAPAGRTD
jgi:uncharacterized protein (TIRG00374 family)